MRRKFYGQFDTRILWPLMSGDRMRSREEGQIMHREENKMSI